MILKLLKKDIVFSATIGLFLCLLFFYKIFLGNIPMPADLIVGGYFPWVEYKWETDAGVPVKNSLLTDAVSLVYPLRSHAIELKKTGEIPLWNSLIFTGYPLIASLPTGIYFPTILFYLFFSSPMAWTLQVVAQVMIAFLSTYALARNFKFSKVASIFAAVSFSFGGFSMIWLEWNTQVAASALLPLLLLFESKLITTKKLKWGVFLSLVLAVQIFAGFLPITIFSLLAMGLWFLFNKSWKTGLKISLFIILGGTLSGILLLPGFELFQYSQRIYETINIREVFVPPSFLISFLFPDFFGNPSTGNFWGEGNYLNAGLYTGTITFVLALIGIFFGRAKLEVKYFIALILLTIASTFNNPLAKIIYQLGIWGGSSMTMNRSLFLINLSVGLLAGVGLDSITRKFSTKYLKIILSIVVITIFLFIICYLLLPSNPSLIVALRNMILPSFLVLFCSLLFVLWYRFKLNTKILQVLLLVVVAAELFRFGWKFNPFTPTKYLYPKTGLSDFLIKQPSSRFVGGVEVLPANMWMQYNLQSIAGYDSVYPLDIAKVLAVINSGDINASPQTKNGVVNSFESRLLDITGTKFIVTLKRDKDNSVSVDGSINFNNKNRFKKVFEQNSVVVLENTDSLPRVYQTFKVIKLNKQDTLKTLMDPNFSTKDTTISEDIELNKEGQVNEQPIYQTISNDHIRVKTSASNTSMLVILDNYYPGWQAKIDDQPINIHRVNYLFRGVVVPSGSHVVDFYYRPKSLIYGIIVSVVSLCILVVILIRQFIRKK